MVDIINIGKNPEFLIADPLHVIFYKKTLQFADLIVCFSAMICVDNEDQIRIYTT